MLDVLHAPQARARVVPVRARVGSSGAAPRVALSFALVGSLWVATAALVGWFLASAPDADARQWSFIACTLLSVTAFSIGVASARGVFRRDWTLMLVAIYIWALGQLLRAADVTGSWEVATWRAIAVLSVGASVLMTVGTLRLARRDGLVPYASVRLDSAIYIIGTTLAWWLASLRELTWAPAAFTEQALYANLPPLGDAIMLIGAAALASSRAAHALSSRSLVLFCFTGLAGDIVFAHYATRNHDILGTWAPALWMVQLTLAATAALASGRYRTSPRTRMSLQSSVLVMTMAGAPSIIALFSAFELGTTRGGATPGVTLGSGPMPLHLRSLVVITVGTAAMAWLIILRSRRLVMQIEGQAVKLERLARTDELTQVANRRAGERLLGDAVRAGSVVDEWGEVQRTVHLAFLDLDHFKQYNDGFGHQAGDELLREAARAWTDALGERGTLFRYGGEEFAVILPATTTDEARAVVAELHHATPLRQTFSGGLAGLRDDEDATALLARADAALYEAKAGGRNRTLVAG